MICGGTWPEAIRLRTAVRSSERVSGLRNQVRRVLYEVPERPPAEAGLERRMTRISLAVVSTKGGGLVEGGSRGRRKGGVTGGGGTEEAMEACMGT